MFIQSLFLMKLKPLSDWKSLNMLRSFWWYKWLLICIFLIQKDSAANFINYTIFRILTT